VQVWRDVTLQERVQEEAALQLEQQFELPAARSELLPGLHEKSGSAAQQLLRTLLLEEADRTFRPRRRHLMSANMKALRIA
jgi:hypothetical protein